MVDIPLVLSDDGTSLDWCDPSVLAGVLDSSDDVETYVLMLLGTDRVAPLIHYRLQPYQRRGSWHDSYVGEFGALFWLGMEENQWGGGSKTAQVQAWAQQALETVYDEGLIQQPATITAEYISQEDMQVNIDLVLADGRQRKIVYVLT